MRILFVSAEVAPFAKVGGLADVAGSLPQALAELGHDVRVLMPAYKMVEANHELRRVVDKFEVQINRNWRKNAYLLEGQHGGVPIWMMGTDQWFTESIDSGTIYRPGADPYLFLTAGATAACDAMGWKPDVIHANDWHTGLLPVLMRYRDAAKWSDVASVFTIHNLAYQGEFGFDILDRLDLPHHLFNLHQLEFFGGVNFLKSGCAFADQVNTVSPRYAKEIQTSEFGCRLDGLMMHLQRQGRLSGILNGIDDREFNPATDPHLVSRFDADALAPKAQCRADLLARLEMEPIPDALLLGVVTRLSGQKGMDLLLQAAEGLFEFPCQLIVQGLGDDWLTSEFRSLEARHPRHFRFINAFDVAQAQRIYGGCDAFLMPSAYEPCGLGQMIAMRYGTVPIVRETGGLADTVRDGINGFTFSYRTADALMDAVRRAHAAFGLGDVWQGMMQVGMRTDFSWSKSAREYERLYVDAISARRGESGRQKIA